MLLSTIKLKSQQAGGEGAADVLKDIHTIQGIANTYGVSYDADIAELRTFYNDAALTYGTMTDAQVLEYFLKGVGDADLVLTAKSARTEKEKLILQVRAAAALFINN